MATKSVLSQSVQLQSSSAAALGSVLNKGKRGGSTQQNGDPDARKRADATNSVVSQAPVPTSAGAKTLGALSNERTERVNATKSVLSQATGMQSGSALALGALLNQSKPSRRGSSPDKVALGTVGEEAIGNEVPSQDENVMKTVTQTNANDVDPPPWESAGMPTRAEHPNWRSNAIESGTTPLFHPDDAKQLHYKDALPQDISVEHYAGPRDSEWACCTRGNVSTTETISRPKTISHTTRLMPVEEPGSPFVIQYVKKPLLGASHECQVCAKEVVDEYTCV